MLLCTLYTPSNTARCLDQYFELRVKEVEQKEAVDIDPRLVAVVERMLDRCALWVWRGVLSGGLCMCATCAEKLQTESAAAGIVVGLVVGRAAAHPTTRVSCLLFVPTLRSPPLPCSQHLPDSQVL